MSIPHVIFQTGRNAHPNEKDVEQIKKTSGCEYKYFSDEQIIQFFNDNPNSEFPNIVNVFHNIKLGAHKADLFRYYYIYKNGGMFLDDDAMIYRNIDEYFDSYELFTCNSIVVHVGPTAFQGILGAVPNHPVIYKSLVSMYNVTPEQLDGNYFFTCKDIYDNIQKYKEENPSAKIFMFDEYQHMNNTYTYIKNEKGEIYFRNFFKDKIVPNTLHEDFDNEDYVKKAEGFTVKNEWSNIYVFTAILVLFFGFLFLYKPIIRVYFENISKLFAKIAKGMFR